MLNRQGKDKDESGVDQVFLNRTVLVEHPSTLVKLTKIATATCFPVVFSLASLDLAVLHQTCNTFFIGLFCQSMSSPIWPSANSALVL